MKLWYLVPVYRDDIALVNPWTCGFGCAWGFVVRAETEPEARQIAHENAGDENPGKNDNYEPPWLSPIYTTCEELTGDGKPGLIIRDFLNE